MQNNLVTIRLATLDDLVAIETLMKCSMECLGKGYYSEEQIQACCQYVCVPDQLLFKDQTYFVALYDKKIVGCGGWSFRNKSHSGPKETHHTYAKLDPLKDSARIRAMFVDPIHSGKGIGSKILEYSENAAKDSGFLRGILMATLSGQAFYKARGWSCIAEEQTIFPNHTSISVIRMEKNF